MQAGLAFQCARHWRSGWTNGERRVLWSGQGLIVTFNTDWSRKNCGDNSETCSGPFSVFKWFLNSFNQNISECMWLRKEKILQTFRLPGSWGLSIIFHLLCTSPHISAGGRFWLHSFSRRVCSCKVVTRLRFLQSAWIKRETGRLLVQNMYAKVCGDPK